LPLLDSSAGSNEGFASRKALCGNAYRHWN